MFSLHTTAAGLPLALETALGAFAVGGAVLAILAYDAYRRRGEWLE